MRQPLSDATLDVIAERGVAADVVTVPREPLPTATQVIENAQERGLAPRDVDASSFALSIQATTVSFAVADRSPDRLADVETCLEVNRLVIDALRPPS
jgi:hypothetical protein